MSPLTGNNITQQFLSAIGGIILATCLFLIIQLLSAVQKTSPDNNTMLVFNLIDLPKTQTTTKKQRPPVKKTLKKLPKKIRKKPEPKHINKTRPAIKNTTPDLKNISTQPAVDTGNEPDEEVLPSPMPFFKLSDLPRFLHREKPIYPEDMRSRGNTGTVELSVLIDKTGKVRKITILKSAGESFDQAAIQAIYASSFMPAMIDGKPVTALLKMPVKFKLM